MAIECHIKYADYCVEAYTEDTFVDPETKVPKTTRTRLAYVAGYRNYDEPEKKQVERWLNVKKSIADIYRGYEDGYVTVELVIKEDYVNP